MSASWPGNMRGPRVKTPLLLLLLLLLTGAVLCQNDAGDEDPEPETEEEDVGDPPEGDGDLEGSELLPTADATSTADHSPTQEGDSVGTLGEDQGSGRGRSLAGPGEYSETTEDPNFTGMTQTTEDTLWEEGSGDEGSGDEGSGDESLSPIIILIPVVLVVLIIGMIVCGIFINRRWNKKARNQELRKEDPYLDGSSTEKVPMPMFEEDVPSVLELEMEELDQWMKKDGEAADDSKHA